MSSTWRGALRNWKANDLTCGVVLLDDLSLCKKEALPREKYELPDSKTVLDKLRKDEDTTIFFFEMVGKAVAGGERWKDNHRVKLWSDFIGPSCEAFAMLLFENNERRWRAVKWNKEHGDDGEKMKVPSALCTQGQSEKGHNYGWENDGRERFAELVKIIQQNRKWAAERGDTVEEEAKKRWMGTGKIGKAKDSGKKDASKNQIASVIDMEAFMD